MSQIVDKGTGLTIRQEAYCQARADGLNHLQSYSSAGYCQNGTAEKRLAAAKKLERNELVADRLAVLREAAAAGCMLSRNQRIAFLTDVATDPEKSDWTRLKAVDMLNKMTGEYIERREVSGTVSLSRADREKAMMDTLEALKSAWKEEYYE